MDNSVSNLDQGLARIQSGVDIINGLIPLAGVIAALTLVYSLIGVMTSFKVYQEYGLSLIQKNGASLHKKNMLQRYHAYILLLKLNIFFSCGIIIQMVGALYYYNKQANIDMEISKNVSKYFVAGACSIMCLVAIIFYAVGYYGVKKASYSLMGVFLLLMVGNGIALIYAIVIASTEPAYKLTIIWLTSFCML